MSRINSTMLRDELAARFARLKGQPKAVACALVTDYALTEDEIAAALGIAHPTLVTHRRMAYAILGVADRLELFALYHALFFDCESCPPSGDDRGG